jgi:hypothetical protein
MVIRRAGRIAYEASGATVCPFSTHRKARRCASIAALSDTVIYRQRDL